MRFVRTFFVVGFLVLILGILETLFESVLALWPMEVTGLGSLVIALGGTLVVLFVVALVVIVTAVVTVVATNRLVIVSTMGMTALVAVILPLAPVVANLVLIVFCQSVAEFALAQNLICFSRFFMSKPPATCELKIFSKYLATDLSFLPLMHRLLQGTLHGPPDGTTYETTQL